LAFQKKIEMYGAEESPNPNMNDMNKRIEFIDSFFPATFCVFEKIVVMRHIYFFIFNVACTFSEAFHT
jgi:hypothetical protein